MLRRMSFATVLAVVLLPGAVGAPDQWFIDPIARRERNLVESDNSGQMHEEWRRGGWLRDDPSGRTPYRIHGGVGPASSSFSD